MSGSCSSVCSPAMVLVKGRMFSEVLKDVKFQGHQLCVVDLKLWTIHQECLVPVLKVCYSRYCVWFAEIYPAFKLKIGNLVTRWWVGICFNWLSLCQRDYFTVASRTEPKWEGDKIFWGHVTAHSYENCVVLFIVVLCSCYTICHWCCVQDNDREWTQSLCYAL
jgi:hypothetical protein